jgi:hypothetical protein
MAMATEMADQRAHAERIRLQFEALAKEYSVKIPEPS